MMKYIFNVKPEDFILAGRAIKSALESDLTDTLIIEFSNGRIFAVRRNKSSISVFSD